ncbi:hypothetical protein MTO96_017180 [Rhipicephalus appendiculatus]
MEDMPPAEAAASSGGCWNCSERRRTKEALLKNACKSDHLGIRNNRVASHSVHTHTCVHISANEADANTVMSRERLSLLSTSLLPGRRALGTSIAGAEDACAPAGVLPGPVWCARQVFR